MPEPFKNFFNAGLIDRMAVHLAARGAGSFDGPAFAARARTGLEALELKARSDLIARALDAHLPGGLDAACALMLAALHPETDASDDAVPADDRGIRGWAVMPMADVVAARALADPDPGAFDRAMDTLAAMTQRFSAEFAIRPLFLHDPDRALAHVRRWTGHPNRHVRRLASEGTRPRLPWGLRLAPFVADPGPLIPILTRLRDDPEDYVRRSVANSLNDIAKDHPDLIAGLAADWLADAPAPRARLVRHALRTLIKQGHPAALGALGHGPASVSLDTLAVTPRIRFGETLDIALTLRSADTEPRKIVLDYVIHHVKANGATSPKVFKWRTLTLAPGETLRLARRHAIRPITTRVYYDGTHRLEIVANGSVLGGADFELAGAPQRVGTGTSPR
jgi:3-methyladenine DNA glycosylase AlkC